MSRIIISSLELKNFKRFKKFFLVPDPIITNVYGDNGTGKTTLLDGWSYLVNNKDSQERENFAIKLLDENNEPAHNLEHTVEAKLLVDDEEITLKKIFKEIWRKKRREAKKTFTGHETIYSLDGVPTLQKDYNAKLKEIFGDSDTLKTITILRYFSESLHWTDRRNILMELVDPVTTAEVVRKNPEVLELDKYLGKKTIDDLRKKNNAEKKKLNDELGQIPARIDECTNTLKEVDVPGLKSELKKTHAELQLINDSLENLTKASPAHIKKQTLLANKRAEKNKVEGEVRATKEGKIKELTAKMNKEMDSQSKLKLEEHAHLNKCAKLSSRIEHLNDLVKELRKQWDDEDGKVFDESKYFNEEDFRKEDDLSFIDEDSCHTCHQSLPPEQKAKAIAENNKIREKLREAKEKARKEMEKAREDFNKGVAETCASIKEKAITANEEIITCEKEYLDEHEEMEKLGSQITLLNDSIAGTQKLITDLRQEPSYDKNYDDLLKEIAEIEKALELPEDVKENTKIAIAEKDRLGNKIDKIKSELHREEVNKQQEVRIAELDAREKEVNQLIADLEKIDLLCDKFIVGKVEILEKAINAKFNLVTFKLFEVQINGAINEVCIPLIDGVPYDDANNGAKMNANIDIINVLSEHYGLTAPIFFDNAESVTNLYPTKSQMIKLVVSKPDKELRVENGKG